ncbi:MAG: 1-(5-phosphoribosyl)-5-((5-phosphoribosylamino)methylideneamino)imidazole-4-carboxamide isomerase [Candidatus Sedimenticola endophacoides]|nr:MAG: 1-(5-phosphoribosyl)-5-((5-phosphoribosylamino)methylideneamino)imidazole-4-carboxamide isomerase [Candidatus Sedimenticola endophacoides]
MNQKSPERVPVEINLHSKSRVLCIEFSDGSRFELPCEYLRVFSKAKEVRTSGAPVTGKEEVNITAIEPQGQYAVRLLFDDGHDTGIYSWDTLYDLGANQERNWRDYLARLSEAGVQRKPDN